MRPAVMNAAVAANASGTVIFRIGTSLSKSKWHEYRRFSAVRGGPRTLESRSRFDESLSGGSAQTQFLHPRCQRAGLDPEQLGGSSAAVHFPARFMQNRQNVGAFRLT